MSSTPETTPPPVPSPWQEITQPFIDLFHASRAMWGINVGNLIEGFVYWGIIDYLAMYFNKYVGLNDIWAGRMVGVLTAGITIAMFFFGGLADRWGVRRAIIASFVLLVGGRFVIALGPTLHIPGGGLLSPLNFVALGGILLVVIGYGMYQPASYTAIREFTTPATAGMGYAMLYGVMNLGGCLPCFMGSVRQAMGIKGAMWVYTAATVLALVATLVLLTRRACAAATAAAKREKSAAPPPADSTAGTTAKRADATEFAGGRVPRTRWSAALVWLKQHPLANARFAFFIFCLIPVQTLFAHNWLTMPQYVARGYSAPAVLAKADIPLPEELAARAAAAAESGASEEIKPVTYKDLPDDIRARLSVLQRATIFIGDYFEFAVNLNPALIFILTPIVAAFTQKSNVYSLMIVGTFVMGAPTLLLALGPTVPNLLLFLVGMSLGEAIWSPRFLQYAAEIAPEGRTGVYMGVAQFPWFLTKAIVPLYSGWFLQRYCPETGTLHTEKMWLIYGAIAMMSTVLLIVSRGWLGKDFKTKALPAA
jgi:proton-dependent oligopeptide transporter, POT family